MAVSSAAAEGLRTGMTESLLHEIAQRLAGLAATGEESAIDLHSLPMTLADRQELEARLGRGEVAADVSIAGTSEIWETQYAGVWWVRHRGADEKIAVERIEITFVPEILASHEDDVTAAATRLNDLLGGVAVESLGEG